jgi:hypothetical protein
MFKQIAANNRAGGWRKKNPIKLDGWVAGCKDALPQGRASRIGMQWRGKQLPFTISQYKYTKLVLYKKPSTVRFLRQALMLY